jgi:lambda repressor-like predicted transcriptional regulator
MTHYERFLEKVTDDIFEAACMEGLTWIGLSNKSGLSTTTVYNLGNRDTRFPQLRTIFLLAKAVGMNVRLLRKEIYNHEAKSQNRKEVNA